MSRSWLVLLLEFVYITVCVFVYLVPVIMYIKKTYWIYVLVPFVNLYLTLLSLQYGYVGGVATFSFTIASLSGVLSLLVMITLRKELYFTTFLLALSQVIFLVSQSVAVAIALIDASVSLALITITMSLTVVNVAISFLHKTRKVLKIYE